MEDANFFEVVASAASGDSCKSPSSVKSGTAAAVVGGQVSFEVHSEFVFPPTSSNLSAANTEVSALRIMLPTSVCMLSWDMGRGKIPNFFFMILSLFLKGNFSKKPAKKIYRVHP